MPQKSGHDVDGLSQARLAKISNSMQPLMYKRATDEDLEEIFEMAEKYVEGGKGSGSSGLLSKCFGKFSKK
jgi:hypothetical protein